MLKNTKVFYKRLTSVILNYQTLTTAPAHVDKFTSIKHTVGCVECKPCGKRTVKCKQTSFKELTCKCTSIMRLEDVKAKVTQVDSYTVSPVKEMCCTPPKCCPPV